MYDVGCKGMNAMYLQFFCRFVSTNLVRYYLLRVLTVPPESGTQRLDH